MFFFFIHLFLNIIQSLYYISCYFRKGRYPFFPPFLSVPLGRDRKCRADENMADGGLLQEHGVIDRRFGDKRVIDGRDHEVLDCIKGRSPGIIRRCVRERLSDL